MPIQEILWSGEPAQSFWFGILSAASLPLGAWVGLWLRPGKEVSGAVMAFGAGSLLAALTLELVESALHHGGFWTLKAGAVLGGLLFVLLNQIVNKRGGFLRKPATRIKHLLRSKRAHMMDLIDKMSHSAVLSNLPPKEIKYLLQAIQIRTYPERNTIYHQGDRGDSMLIIESGEVEVIRNGRVIATLGPGDTVGEMALLHDEPRNATVRARTEVCAWQILKDDFDRLVRRSPKLHEALQALSEERLQANLDRKAWEREMVSQMGTISFNISDRELHEANRDAAGHGSAALAIWLGILLDGIPESAVIGASMTQSSVSLALIGGLFFANFPEALSSAVGMRDQGMGVGKISWMWISLMLMTGIGALLGNLFFEGASPFLFALFEGIAAGAMLTMVAETMLPEAYENGHEVTGLCTLFGFLTAIFFTTLD